MSTYGILNIIISSTLGLMGLILSLRNLNKNKEFGDGAMYFIIPCVALILVITLSWYLKLLGLK